MLQRERVAVADPPEPPDVQRLDERTLSELGIPVVGLEDLRDRGEERGGVGAVEGAVVPRQREVADRVDGDRLVAVGVGDHHRPPLHAVGREDRDLRLVDDRQRASSVPYGPALVMVNVPPAMSSGDELLGAGPAGEVGDLAGDGPQPLVVGVVDDRHDQALEVEVDGDAEVDVVVHDQLVLADRGVDVRELARWRRPRARAMNGR